MNSAHLGDLFDEDGDGEDMWPALQTFPSGAPAGGADGHSGEDRGRANGQKRPRGGVKPLRARQRAINSLEAELEAKLEAFRKAQEEKIKLQQRIKVLEVVLPVREQQVQMLKQKQQMPGRPLHKSPMVRITDMAAGNSSDCCTSDSGCSSPPSEEPIAKDLPHVMSSDPDLAATAVTCGVAPSASPALPGEDLCLAPSPPRVVRGGACGTPAHVIRQFMSMWSQWVREAGLILHSADARPRDPGPQLKLAALRERLMARVRVMRTENPHLWKDIIGRNLETGEHEEPPPDSFWISVVQALRLTPEQVADCRAALELFQERIRAVQAEREALTSRFASLVAAERRQQQQAAQVQRAQHQHQQKGCFTASCGESHLQLMDVSTQLQRNVLVEGQAMEVVKDFMGSCLFSMTQSVRASVLCYPFFPDALSILVTVAETAEPAAFDPAVALTK